MLIDCDTLPFRDARRCRARRHRRRATQRGTIVLVNAEAERMFGYARDELLGKPIEHARPRARARRATPSTSRAYTRRRGCGRWARASSCSAAARTAASSRSRSACRRSSTARACWSSPASATSPSAAQLEREAQARERVPGVRGRGDPGRVRAVRRARSRRAGEQRVPPAARRRARRRDRRPPVRRAAARRARAPACSTSATRSREALFAALARVPPRAVGHARGAHRHAAATCA